MIRLFGRDTGVQFALCEMLDLQGIGRLHGCCRSWRRWIDQGTFGSSRMLQFDFRVPVSLLQSTWAPRYVQRLALGISPKFHSQRDEKHYHYHEWSLSQKAAGFEEGRVDEIALRPLPRFNRLRALQLVLRHDDKRFVLPHLLPLTSATLTSLAINVRFLWLRSPARMRDPLPSDPFLPSFLRSLGGIPSLTSLTLESDHGLADVSLDALPSLVHLQRLFSPRNRVRFSPTQVAALVACRALTDLDAGEWIPRIGDSNEDYRPSVAQRKKWLKEGLVVLITGRKLNGAAPLRKLRLGDPKNEGCITPAVAAHLLTLSLESLERVVWSADLTSEHWSQLSLFTRLHTIDIGAVTTELEQDRASLKLDAPLLALQHCPLLSSVSLTGVAEAAPVALSSEHAVLLAALPRLASLSLRFVCVESLAPLSTAPALAHLMMDRCSGVSKPFSMRAAVPHLLLLTLLSILRDATVPEERTATAADKLASAAVTKSLLDRLPLLRADAFEHSGPPPRSWTGSIYAPPRDPPAVRI